MTFHIRAAQPGDAPAIAHVQVETWRSTYAGIVPDPFLAALDKQGRTQNWQALLADPTIDIFVAEDETGVFGFITGGAIRDPAEDYDAELYAIYLLQQHQQRGAGRALVRTLAASLHAKGLRKLIVWALEENPGVEFYKRLGAIPVTTKIINIGGKDLSDLALGWTSLSSLL
jgi:ribosomal protein S18 acetylase RimI-like enzyme